MALLLSACTEHRPAPSTLDTPDAAPTVETARGFYAAQARYLHPVDPGGTPKPLADLRAALEEDPENPRLQELLLAHHHQQVELMRRLAS